MVSHEGRATGRTDGGPAYPGHGYHPGMSFLDVAALAALPEVLRFEHLESYEEVAREAYRFAEAMVRERERRRT